MTNDRTIHRLNYQWQVSLDFNSPILGQCGVIFIGTIKCFNLCIAADNPNSQLTTVQTKTKYYKT